MSPQAVKALPTKTDGIRASGATELSQKKQDFPKFGIMASVIVIYVGPAKTVIEDAMKQPRKDDWFREPCLTDSAKLQFERKLRGARSARPEYMRVQAHALTEAGLFTEAYSLLVRISAEYPDHLPATISEWKANCHRELGRVEEALQLYQESIDLMRRTRGERTEAPIAFASLVCTIKRCQLYEVALAQLMEFWDPNPIFPIYELQQFGWSAILSHRMGRREDALTLGQRALAAAEKTSSGAAKHRRLGLVEGKLSDLRTELTQIFADRISESRPKRKTLREAVRKLFG